MLSSNGSTSMASVCGSTLSLMDAGVPIKAPVAGIAMGMIADDGKFVTLTDILGAEDALGDMDFKVAGTREFVTAIQLDMKVTGLPGDVLAGALQQARDARFTILDVMEGAIAMPREEVNAKAPRIISIQIPVDKIGEVIGPKGKRINEIIAATGADIDIQDDGTVFIGSELGGEGADEAAHMIDEIANPRPVLVGEQYDGGRGQDDDVRRLREPGARPRRPGAHLQARTRQAPEQRRGGDQGRRQAHGPGRGHRRPGQDQPEAGRRGVGHPRGAGRRIRRRTSARRP